MSTTRPNPRATTPPKGRPTRRQPRTVEANNRRATLGWVGVGLAVAAVIGAAVYFGADQEPQPLHTGSAIVSTG